jgi:hypothetical protein
MKLGMMQPYAFPYLGYFQLIHHCDTWVVFDDTQFVRKSWVTRNRILHPEPAKQWQYVAIPVQHEPLGTMIRDVKIDRDHGWRESILGKLSSYRQAPCYDAVRTLVADCLDADCESIAQWNVSALQAVCNYLGVRFDYEYSSNLGYNRGSITHPGQWALETAAYLGANEYVNPAGGHEIFHAAEFGARGVGLRFLRPALKSYAQGRDGFIAALSITDVMMWNRIGQIRDMLDAYAIIEHEQAKTGPAYTQP